MGILTEGFDRPVGRAMIGKDVGLGLAFYPRHEPLLILSLQ
jgi:hypothetical protein